MAQSSNSPARSGIGMTAMSHDGVLPSHEPREERSRVIAVVCHELRNSLMVVGNAARLLRNPSSPGAVESARTLIERHVGQMSRHIEALIESRHPGAHGTSPHRARVDLRTIARYAMDSIGPELARHGHRLTVHLPDEPVWAHADGTQLEQAFSNLLINAAKYTPDGGEIGLLIESRNESVYVRIRDSGIGIEPAMLSQVFGMFVQAPSGMPGKEPGCGIGLAVVRAVVEQHGGTVTAASAGLGLGSEFTIVLPSLKAQHGSVVVAP